jgi:hypothetical protein
MVFLKIFVMHAISETAKLICLAVPTINLILFNYHWGNVVHVHSTHTFVKNNEDWGCISPTLQTGPSTGLVINWVAALLAVVSPSLRLLWYVQFNTRKVSWKNKGLFIWNKWKRCIKIIQLSNCCIV